MRAVKLTFCLGVLVFAVASQVFAAITDPVRVEQGQLAGTSGRSPDVRVYRGVPFAAPPVGDLRGNLRSLRRPGRESGRQLSSVTPVRSLPFRPMGSTAPRLCRSAKTACT